MQKTEKVSWLRTRYPNLPRFYDEKGDLITCSCGNIADMAVCKPSNRLIENTHSDCYDCMRPVS